MRTYAPVLLASLLALGASSLVAADLTPEERTELRARAEQRHAARAQNVTRVSDSVPIDRPRGDVRLDRDRGDIKADQQTTDVKPQKQRSIKAKPKERKKKRARRSLKDLPGALVRGR
ncbi:MAG TPA: hypothetical protein VED01_05835 [Burkholderiales bacterium]|nr:hypothetical protein [Burkholderiales bacterium]